jgi:hypothetical protein
MLCQDRNKLSKTLSSIMVIALSIISNAILYTYRNPLNPIAKTSRQKESTNYIGD